MLTGIYVDTFEELADVRLLSRLAVEAEEAGWDGFFLCDQIVWPWADHIVDTTVALTAIALATSRIRFGPLVVPLPRRRPAKVAREYATLDHLSGGRLVFGAGAGGFREEFADLGEAGVDDRTRAAMLDESLTLLSRFWSGESFDHEGVHYQVRQTRFRPTPLQRPRIPVWIGGQWPREGPVARAARWDGFVPQRTDGAPITPGDLRGIKERLGLPREGFDLVAYGEPEPGLAELAECGATWWVYARPPWSVSASKVRDRIAAGPPRDRQPTSST
jgi:alkanesulfonate monooxygenase SsuD/methylene tetrahydromethanopterin reductase-like flavin-dependent oxidoreductase (luciferase family)